MSILSLWFVYLKVSIKKENVNSSLEDYKSHASYLVRLPCKTRTLILMPFDSLNTNFTPPCNFFLMQKYF